MALTIDEVTHIAELAKLALSDAEKEMFREQLSDILAYAETLQSINTDAIPPTASVLDLQSVMRADEVQPSMPLEDVLANAPAEEYGQFKVNAVLD